MSLCGEVSLICLFSSDLFKSTLLPLSLVLLPHRLVTQHWQLPAEFPVATHGSIHVRVQLTALVPAALYIATLERKRGGRERHGACPQQPQPASPTTSLHAHHVLILVLYWLRIYCSGSRLGTPVHRTQLRRLVLLTTAQKDLSMNCESEFTFTLFQ